LNLGARESLSTSCFKFRFIVYKLCYLIASIYFSRNNEKENAS
jgi:hypothetical protein